MKYNKFSELPDEVKNEFSQFLKKSINEAREETFKATENGEKFTEELLNQLIQSVARVYVFAEMDVITELFSGLFIESFAPLIKKIFISVYNDKNDKAAKELEKLVGE